jgi:hypothetical protein
MQAQQPLVYVVDETNWYVTLFQEPGCAVIATVHGNVHPFSNVDTRYVVQSLMTVLAKLEPRKLYISNAFHDRLIDCRMGKRHLLVCAQRAQRLRHGPGAPLRFAVAHEDLMPRWQKMEATDAVLHFANLASPERLEGSSDGYAQWVAQFQINVPATKIARAPLMDPTVTFVAFQDAIAISPNEYVDDAPVPTLDRLQRGLDLEALEGNFCVLTRSIKLVYPAGASTSSALYLRRSERYDRALRFGKPNEPTIYAVHADDGFRRLRWNELPRLGDNNVKVPPMPKFHGVEPIEDKPDESDLEELEIWPFLHMGRPSLMH